ncbi:MAG: Arc family DNA-binding protein [Alphaproteobacteria bacterium]|nr:Arc family DNA-binding protein [Alphaproteobacteria bacterium]MBU1550184.1 Arc family DNA-binding protein [Alphaproteobacteria bacterium]MBU2337895.1 Arc family DNA-binding protein [Alphaproteobacteria bacterium]MBU2387875.1 Arc family DNA-binding protein [Alphaproteobacteria bacterium]
MVEDQNRTYQDKFMLRMPDGMRERLKDEASKSGRSMNAEIVHRLANSLESPQFNDFALGLGEELDFSLMVAANYSGRSLQEEMIYRLQQSLAPETTLIRELEQKAWDARRQYDEMMKLFVQLTPEERRLLEERAEIAEFARKAKVSSRNIGKFVKLNPIGNRGRYHLRLPQSDYTPILGKAATETEMKEIVNEVRLSGELEADD